MSKRRDLETRIHSLHEIEEIMNAMKNISLMETHRLARFLSTQRRVVTTIESAAADFLRFHPRLLRAGEHYRDVYLLIGSERGFCGDFNESVLRAFEREGGAKEAKVVVVGGRLESRVPEGFHVAAFVDGASVVEEVDPVLSKLTDALNNLGTSNSETAPLRLTVFHHEPDRDEVRVSRLTPFREVMPPVAPFAYGPELNLEARTFLARLTEQYLDAVLHELLYRSLMAENQRRMQHMDSAVRLLERTAKDLWQQRNIVRQEEITQEIEVIMLSVEAFR
jgi:F-type H+-transporting ATPase subunit gamma